MANRYEFEYEEDDDFEYEGVPQKEISRIKSQNRDMARRETQRKNSKHFSYKHI